MRRAVVLVAGVLLVMGCSLVTDLDGLSGGAERVGPNEAGADGSVIRDDATPPPDAAIDAPEAGADAEAGPSTDKLKVAVLADAPVSYFRFEESSGATCANEGTGTATCVFGTSNLTLGVAGSGGGRKGVRLDQATALITLVGGLPYSGMQPFTLEITVSFQTVENGTLFKNENVSPPRTGQLLFLESTGLTVRSETWSSATLLYYGASPTTPTADAWYHIVYGYDDVADKDFVYVNASAATAGKLNAGFRVKPTTEPTLGGLKMTLDDVAIYDKALSPAQIAAHFTSL